MRFITSLLKVINIILGAVLIIGGTAAYFLWGKVIPFYLALGLVAVGPLEDLLVRTLGQTGNPPSPLRALIDQITSLVLELFLLAAAYAAVIS